MNLSVVIAWCNRPEILQTLPQNIRSNALKDTEILVINGGGDAEILHSLNQLDGGARIRLLTLDGVQEFNKSECLNVGAYFSRREFLFTLDADIEVPSDFLDAALPRVAAERCFLTIEEVIDVTPETCEPAGQRQSFIASKTVTTEYLAENGRRALVRHRIGRDGSRTGPGLVILRKDDFLAINGLNSELRGWGYEDYDFQIRLQLGLGLKRVGTGRVLHHPHPPVTSARESNVRNAAACRARYERGDFSGTFAADARRWCDRVSTITYSSGCQQSVSG
jgi:predicted glycosyltransferase involved in capsule biosynthesis